MDLLPFENSPGVPLHWDAHLLHSHDHMLYCHLILESFSFLAALVLVYLFGTLGNLTVFSIFGAIVMDHSDPPLL